MKSNSILNGIKWFDCFGEQISFTVQKKRKYHTVLGGLLCFAISIIVIVIGLMNLITFCERKRYTGNTFYHKRKSSLLLNYSVSVNIDGVNVKESNNVFINNIEVYAYLNGNKVNYDKRENIFYINQTISDSLITDIVIKDHSDSNNVLSYIDAHEVTIDINYSNRYIDMSSVSTPVQTIKEKISIPVVSSMVAKVKMSLLHEKYESDSNIVVSRFRKETFESLSLDNMIMVNKKSGSFLLCSITVEPKEYEKITQRVYEKLLDVIANIVSLTIVLFYIVFIIVSLYIDSTLEQFLINNSIWYKDKIIPKNKSNFDYLKDLFNERKNNINKKDNEILITNQEETKRTQKEEEDPDSESNSDQRISSESLSNKTHNDNKSSKKVVTRLKLKSDNTNRFETRIIPEHYIPIYHTFLSSDNLRNKYQNESNNKNSSSYLCCNSSYKKKKERENILYSLAKIDIFSTIDILNFLKKMREVEIMKYALFSLDEIKLVQFLSKPSYSLNLNRNDFPLNEMNEVFDFSREKIEGLYNSFENVYRDERSNKTENLLKLTSYELYQLIQN